LYKKIRGILGKKRKILYAVLNWGLGHATRSLPVIRRLAFNNDVTILSTGRSLEFLKAELPDLEFIDHEDYSVRYTKSGFSMIPYMAFQLPKIFLRLKEEQKYTEMLVEKYKFDRIVSDNRYGIYSESIPSFFITHQLRFKLPGQLSIFERFSEYFNKFYFRSYRKIFIPDAEKPPCLSGVLSHDLASIQRTKLVYTGILADLDFEIEPVQSDYLIIVSGPEPQRSIFEEKVRAQSKLLKGKIIIVCGRTEERKVGSEDGVTVYSHASRRELFAMMKGTKTVISRPGYSSVMEIVSMNKKALFIPTPGQTEQEYLADYFREKGYFHSVTQEKMDLATDVIQAENTVCSLDMIPNDISGMINEIEA